MVEWETLGGEPRSPFVEEGDEMVTITAVEDVSHLGADDAVAGGLLRRAEVRLEQPLGPRKVIDGATGRAVPYG